MSTDKMQRQRFELKYMLTPEQALEIRRFISGHLELDENGVGKPDNSYPVHSLYLDSDSLGTYWSTINGDKNRYKLRLRFYNDHPDSPVFFEIKRRMDNCIMKQRGGVRKEAVPWILSGHLPSPDQLLSKDAKPLVAIHRFCELTQKIQARPKSHVAYSREAWVHPDHDNVRVTFDRHVRAEPRPDISFKTEMVQPVYPFGDEVILELKFTNRFPDWLREMVRVFGLHQCGAAKYCEGVTLIGEDSLDDRMHRALQGHPRATGARRDFDEDSRVWPRSKTASFVPTPAISWK